METVIQVKTHGSVSATNLISSLMPSQSRTISFWLFDNSVSYEDFRFLSVDMYCSDVTAATFSLSLKNGKNLKARFSTFSRLSDSPGAALSSVDLLLQPLQLLPSDPTSVSPAWYYLALTFDTNSIELYVDNAVRSFPPSSFANLSCPSFSIANVTLQFSPNSNKTQANDDISMMFSQFRVFDGSFNPAYRGYVENSQTNTLDIRPATESDLSRDGNSSFLSWNFNLCNCTSFNSYKSTSNNESAVLTSNSRVSIVFRSVPWLLPQVDAFSPGFGYYYYIILYYIYILAPHFFCFNLNSLDAGFPGKKQT
jgi:hypothetical protein